MTLTLALAVIAAVVLAGVVAQGVWSARRASPRRAEPVAEAARVEPSLASPAEGEATSHAAAAGAADESPAPVSLAEARPLPVKRNVPRLDALIDAIATLPLEAPTTGEAALMHLPTTRRAGTKPFLIEGLNDGTGEWEPPTHGQRYREFQAGVQLANRNGALNEIEYSEFVHKVQAFAEGVGALPEFPDMIDAVARARELDAFASPHDAQLSVHLRAQSVAWSVGYIQQCALRHGFVPGAVPGRLVLPAQEEGAPAVLVLGFDPQAALAEDPNEAAVHDIVLTLDVPQTEAAAEPFAAWQEAARALSKDMDAALVDEAGRPLTLHAFQAIGQELQQLYAALEERDLAAGSAAARRLFS
jgi:hypothetical protein